MFSADITPEMPKLCSFTKVKVFFLVLVHVFNFDVIEFSAAILEKGLLLGLPWENATVFLAKRGGHGPRRSMCRPRELGTRTRHCSLVTELYSPEMIPTPKCSPLFFLSTPNRSRIK